MNIRLIGGTALTLLATLVAVDIAVADDVATAGKVAKSVVIGSAAPDFTMMGIDGKEFKLSDVTKSGKNVSLMFSRAHW
ncbi:MAG: hypothetical protein WBD20_25035 [Pirellulaceae bacterium]